MGTVQKRYGDQKEDINKWADKWFRDYETTQGKRKAS
jgi:uncharacterized protein YjbJ (UPF0337 family)